MAGSDDAQRVTSAAVRDGDPTALAALCSGRGPAVLAYAEAVLPADAAVRAAAEAFARFRAAALALGDGGAPDGLLLSATRRAVAALVPPPTGRMGARRTCPQMPLLLVARLEGELSAADRARVARHLGRCPACTALAARFADAERAFAAPPPGPPPPHATAAIVGALAAAGAGGAEAPPAAAPPPHEPVAPPPEAAPAGAPDPPVPAPAPEFPAPTPEPPAPARPPAPVPPADDAITSLMPPVGHASDVAPAQPLPAARAAPPAFARPARPRVHLPDSGVVRTVVLPLGVVGVAAVLAMAIAGVFGQDEPPPVPTTPPISAPAEPLPGGAPAGPGGERVRPGSAPPPGIPTTPAEDFAGGLGVPGPGVDAQ